MLKYRIIQWFEKGIDSERYTVQKKRWLFWFNLHTFQKFKPAFILILVLLKKDRKKKEQQAKYKD